MTLTEFLLARIAEDEAVAQSAVEHDWPRSIDDRWVEGAGTPSNVAYFAQVEHVERFTPARVLAECEAKRRIVEIAVGDWDPESIEKNVREHRGPSLVHGEDGEAEWFDEWTTTRLLRTLALTYADHPDYDDSWRP